jgi:endonuclease-3
VQIWGRHSATQLRTRRYNLATLREQEGKFGVLLPRLRKRAEFVARVLEGAYHSPTHNNKPDPLDELIFILLSQMTTHRSFERVYDRLKRAAPTWDIVLAMPTAKLRRIIKDAGLSNQKAPRIKAILKRIHAEFGRLSLDALRRMTTEDAEFYLTSLPGVSQKTAKCVLMYSLKRPVLPVDTHILRVSRRLGLTERTVIGTAVHADLEAIVRPANRHGFHVNVLAHGRAVCLAKAPRCAACCVRKLCQFSGMNYKDADALSHSRLRLSSATLRRRGG